MLRCSPLMMRMRRRFQRARKERRKEKKEMETWQTLLGLEERSASAAKRASATAWKHSGTWLSVLRL